MYVAVAAAWLGRATLSRQSASLRHSVTFILTLVLLCRAHRIQRLRMGGPAILGQQIIRTVLKDLNAKGVTIPGQERVLVIEDPFSGQGYDMLMLLRLYARDPALEVDHASADDGRHRVVLQFSRAAPGQARF